MEIKVKGVSNGYIIEYTEDIYNETCTKTAVQTNGDELKKFISGLIVKEFITRRYDGQNSITIQID